MRVRFESDYIYLCKTLSVQWTFCQSRNIRITQFPENIVSHSDWQYRNFASPAWFYQSLTDGLAVSSWLCGIGYQIITFVREGNQRQLGDSSSKDAVAILSLMFSFSSLLFCFSCTNCWTKSWVAGDFRQILIWHHCNVWVAVCCDISKSINKLFFINQ